jgi:hypothetical protein
MVISMLKLSVINPSHTNAGPVRSVKFGNQPSDNAFRRTGNNKQPRNPAFLSCLTTGIPRNLLIGAVAGVLVSLFPPALPFAAPIAVILALSAFIMAAIARPIQPSKVEFKNSPKLAEHVRYNEKGQRIITVTDIPEDGNWKKSPLLKDGNILENLDFSQLKNVDTYYGLESILLELIP